MFSSVSIIGIFCLYMALLFVVALWVERRSSRGVNLADNPVVYALSMAVYCTTWTYYGSVGKATTSGMLFATVYLGPTLTMLVWWTLLRKMIRLKNAQRITSIADFISARYDKSRRVAALVTLIAIVGITPYLAIQIKAVIATFEIIVRPEEVHTGGVDVGLIIVVLMTIFTIMFGVRRLDPTERHPGMMVALAVECVIKLVAFLAAGIFVTYFLFDGINDILLRAEQLPGRIAYHSGEESIAYYMNWTSFLILSMAAILFLPRQFHVAVVENYDERHLRTALWLFPLYLFLINLFVYPIAMAGLLLGFPISQADTFVLSLPLHAGQQWLSLFVFLGGFSAAAGMVMVSAMTLSTMFINHLMLPVLEWFGGVPFIKRHLLQCRWTAVAVSIFVGYLFADQVGESFMLVNIGMISFAAVFQFAPALLGGLFWRRGSTFGALMGLASGFLVWFYTLLLPIICRSGWLGEALLTNGPFGLAPLRPEHLFGISGLDPLSHALFWSVICNGGGYVLGSLLVPSVGANRDMTAASFAEAIRSFPGVKNTQEHLFIELAGKRAEIKELLSQYLSEARALQIVDSIIVGRGLQDRETISIVELVEIHRGTERLLAGSIGAAAAYHAVSQGVKYTPEEQRALSEAYAVLLAELKLTPADLRAKSDFHRERHELLTRQAGELEDKVSELRSEIEERRRVEQALRESESKYHSLVDNINIGVYRNSSGRGRFLQANPAMAKIFGYESLEEFMQVEVVDLYQNSDDRQSFLEEVLRAGFVRDREIAMRKKDGTEIWCSASATAHFDENGEIAWLDGVLEEVTERKRLEEQLRHSQKMEAIGTLAGGVAHDFNNILTAIIGYGSLLKMKLGEESPLCGYANQILNSSEKAAVLTRSLLAFSRKQVISPKPVDLNGIIAALDELLRRIIGEDIEFCTVLAEGDLVIMADTGQIEQVLVNLASNSRDAMPRGGVLTIATARVEISEENARVPGFPAAGAYALVTVTDTGEGMAQTIRERIFEPFFTTKEVGKGTGLGLSIVYGIVKQHNGEVHVYSERHRGTSFRIYLPLVASPPSRLENHDTEEMVEGGSETILVAEDSSDVRRLLVSVLRQFGYSVVEAVDGADAVRLFADQADRIDLVLLDVVMPRLNGKEAYLRIKELRNDVKVIFSSGYTYDIIEKKGILEEGIPFLEKPVLPHTLLSSVRQTLDGLVPNRKSSQNASRG